MEKKSTRTNLYEVILRNSSFFVGFSSVIPVELGYACEFNSAAHSIKHVRNPTVVSEQSLAKTIENRCFISNLGNFRIFGLNRLDLLKNI